jgi:hypothetical protein
MYGPIEEPDMSNKSKPRPFPGHSERSVIPAPWLAAGLFIAVAGTAQAELQRLGESEMSAVSGQGGLSIEIPHLRINAYGRGSVDNPITTADESDGRRTKGFKFDYVTTEHSGGGETHFFVDEVSLAMDIVGALTLDVEEDGALLIGLPEQINYVGDGLSLHGIYLNTTGTPDMGGKLLNEINVQGNFNTGGTVRMWSD